jgi:hypothetical protein
LAARVDARIWALIRASASPYARIDDAAVASVSV